jgi:hypothetical protein
MPTPVVSQIYSFYFSFVMSTPSVPSTTDPLTFHFITGSRKQKVQLHPGDIRFTDAGDYDSAKDFRGEKVKVDTYGLSHQEKGRYSIL